MQVLSNWFRRNFSDPQILFLAFFLLSLLVVVVTLGNMLTPVLASIVIAYLLEGMVGFLERRGWPRLIGSLMVLLVFMLFLASLLLLVMPLLWRQATDLLQQLPGMLTMWQQALMRLPERYPELITSEQIRALITAIRNEIGYFGQKLLSLSMSSVVGVITVIVYVILMPLLVFFFLKDKDLILSWFKRYLPKHRGVASTVWREVDRQIYNYVRGKVWEILIVWAVSFAAFWAFGLNYALLLAVLVGVSVIVPYIGASVVTIPVVLIAWFQWGWAPQLLWLLSVYLVIQAIDGNVLVPLLFSEVVDLHPVAIIVAILVFGGIWGFWGVFFAIPLATLVQAVLCAWPPERMQSQGPTNSDA
ncbi:MULTISPECIES: AI-2E family transporter [Thiorhodovibrio]|uniref:AI-2E family transporter n=1 Tax=Thiorhodovibrio TaxID=61593 RepID=UPI0019131DA1|nr:MULTISPECIES: AI-2E family transporter [Thiorhodovibrio]MBK5970086.1 AI-2E family transporter [Thiorhodovibrio winogradskyi]WPL13468.1 pheromone autoinducer 2 transporter [Thiorhodovibrio litoralis]